MLGAEPRQRPDVQGPLGPAATVELDCPAASAHTDVGAASPSRVACLRAHQAEVESSPGRLHQLCVPGPHWAESRVTWLRRRRGFLSNLRLPVTAASQLLRGPASVPTAGSPPRTRPEPRGSRLLGDPSLPRTPHLPVCHPSQRLGGLLSAPAPCPPGREPLPRWVGSARGRARWGLGRPDVLVPGLGGFVSAAGAVNVVAPEPKLGPESGLCCLYCPCGLGTLLKSWVLYCSQ